jgi:hypothetical protein
MSLLPLVADYGSSSEEEDECIQKKTLPETFPKKKQPVQIVLPSLKETTDTEQTPTITTAATRGGLFASLPAPKSKITQSVVQQKDVAQVDHSPDPEPVSKPKKRRMLGQAASEGGGTGLMLAAPMSRRTIQRKMTDVANKKEPITKALPADKDTAGPVSYFNLGKTVVCFINQKVFIWFLQMSWMMPLNPPTLWAHNGGPSIISPMSIPLRNRFNTHKMCTTH